MWGKMTCFGQSQITVGFWKLGSLTVVRLSIMDTPCFLLNQLPRKCMIGFESGQITLEPIWIAKQL